MKVFYNEAYMAPAYAFDTTRKSGEIAAAVDEGETIADALFDAFDVANGETCWLAGGLTGFHNF